MKNKKMYLAYFSSEMVELLISLGPIYLIIKNLAYGIR